ncbi:Fc.00g003840.m01.CDS01 [Cosmosporella sp. VM-42]
MSSPHVPRTSTALPLDDSSRDLSLNRDPNLGFRPRPTLTSSSHHLDNAQTPASNAATHPYTLSNASVSTPPLVHFRSTTIAPSPPPQYEDSPSHHDALLTPETIYPGAGDRAAYSPVGALRISTDFVAPPATPIRRESFNNHANVSNSRAALSSLNHKASTGSLRPISRTPSLKTALANSIGSASGASSCYPSPIISAMGEVTPLPSPLMSGDSPGPWKRLSAGSASPPPSRLRSVGEQSVLVTSSGESIDAALAYGPKRKMYSSLEPGEHPPAQSANGHQQHTRNRSISEYTPDPMAIPKRKATVSGSHPNIDITTGGQLEPHMRREHNFAESRGLTQSATEPPTPPPSESSRDSGDGSSKTKTPRIEFFEASGRVDKIRRRWRSIRLLGQGTFSRVMLATSQTELEDEVPETESGLLTPKPDLNLDRKTLVAVKVCEHGPRGGASEERVEMSLKRELEIMQTIHHPSLVDLKAWSIEPTRAILVLSYCPGGDLFDVATSHRSVLQPALLQRMFAELVGAVSYLHERRIVHRDIKLENVLVNLTASELADPSMDWATYPYSVVTLTDLGLSRRIADDEKLETRCGSEDYAAPEVIMGQPYDGRATDAWSLGVLLYALLEARLPFDPPPDMSDAHRMRSRTSHRIARVEWIWVDYAGEDTDHDGDEAKFQERGLLGAMEITEGLLKRARSRWSVEKVSKKPWVVDAIKVDGGLRFREEKDGELVS